MAPVLFVSVLYLGLRAGLALKRHLSEASSCSQVTEKGAIEPKAAADPLDTSPALPLTVTVDLSADACPVAAAEPDNRIFQYSNFEACSNFIRINIFIYQIIYST